MGAPSEGPTARDGVVRDEVDVRDRYYEPTLARLSPSLLPPREFVEALASPGRPWGLPRFQGEAPTCGGHALAALIDIERMRAGVHEPQPASARMLYAMAHRVRQAVADDGISLRDLIKGFYNYGVCADKVWPYSPEDSYGNLSLERARDARNVSLGAYYRLRPNLNSYHAALHEAGAVLVSAHTHSGWEGDALAKTKAVILPPKPGDQDAYAAAAGHAFLIVGYVPEGFLVLNSWGADWGRWLLSDKSNPVELPGIALWKYEDWADSIMDGWVLRLGVGPAEAFDFSIGDQGLGFGRDESVRSTPVHAILGNYLHLDDGAYVSSGSYPSTKVTIEETFRLLVEDAKAKRPYTGMLLTFASALQGLKDAADQIVRRKRLIRNHGWYPLTILWCVDYVDQARAVLNGVFEEALERAGKAGPTLDRIIEERAYGVGRAFWRDMRRSAATSAALGGPLDDLAASLAALVAVRPKFRLKIVTESEGAFALDAFVRALFRNPDARRHREAVFQMLDSVDLIAPPMTRAEFMDLARQLDSGWGASVSRPPIVLHFPTCADERRLSVPPYGRSYFQLVRRAFARDASTPVVTDVAACDDTDPDSVARQWADWREAPRTRLVPIRWRKGTVSDPISPITQIDLLFRSDVDGRLRDLLARV